MSKIILPFQAADISRLARSLGRELQSHAEKPGHVELLNMLVRGIGFRNFQHFRAHLASEQKLNNLKKDIAEQPDWSLVERVSRHFDSLARLTHWPSKYSHQQLCLWLIWSRIPPREILSEKQVNKIIKTNIAFDDFVLIRRELCNGKWTRRTSDCREYERIERKPGADALALIRHLDKFATATA